MTKKTNLFLNLKKPREINFLRIAGTSLLLLCATPQLAIADTLEKNTTVTMQQAKAETVTGVVTDVSGDAIIGASVVVKGTSNGTITDLNGRYSLANVPEKAVLEFSYIGMQKQDVNVAGKTVINITLREDAQALDEVVVTALGLKREQKALGYAVTEIKGDDLKGANTINPVSALQGKVAGVEISQSDGGMFGSTKIQIRGASTLKGNNQPIYVVDGIILDNSTSNAGDADWDSRINDYGNELKNLNPDDFQSVSVLKGAAATALYGSRGLNGAVVITTKSGKKGSGFGVTLSQTFGTDYVFATPKLQNQYGEGAYAGYAYYGSNRWNSNSFAKNAAGQNSMIAMHEDDFGAGWHWGPRYDGSSIENFDKTTTSYNAIKNNYRDAYQLGFNSNTNVAVSGGNETTTFYSSLSYKYANGTLPNNSFDRLSFLAKAAHQISKRVNLEASISFANSNPKNAQPNIGEYFTSGTLGRAYDTNYFRDKYKGSHGGLADTKYGDEYSHVPGRDLWWNIYENNYTQKETSVRPTLNLTIDILDWLTFRGEANYNYYYKNWESKELGKEYATAGGYYQLGNHAKEQANAAANLTVNKRLNDDFEVHGFLRGEYYDQKVQYATAWTDGGLIVPGQFFLTNSKNQYKAEAKVQGTKRMMSVAFQAGASWRNQLYLDITGRNDWSSSLVYTNQTGNYSYFYPSISGSWILSETFDLPEWVSFAKARTSWAQVGNDTDPYYINTGYELGSTQFGSSYVYSLGLNNTVKSTDLKPERKSAWEIGLDWRFLDNRINLDATYYKENTRNQIMEIAVPYVSGISKQLINAGNIQNSGIEVALNTVPIRTKDFEWTVDFTYTKNTNKIISLHENVADYITLTGDVAYGNYRIGSVAQVGGAYGLLLSDSKPKIDEKTGLEVLSWHATTRTPYAQRSGVAEELGSLTPDFLGSVATGFTYKDWTLRVALDMRFGGYVASYASKYGLANGMTDTSLKYREGMTWTSRLAEDAGTVYNDGYIPQGIFGEGVKVMSLAGTEVNVGGKTYQQCVDEGILDPVHISNFYARRNGWGQGVVNDDWFKKLNYIALREITVAYRCPTTFAKRIGARNLSLSLSGRNLGYLLNTMPNNENPESVRGTSATEFRARSFSPYTANFIFSINAGF